MSVPHFHRLNSGLRPSGINWRGRGFAHPVLLCVCQPRQLPTPLDSPRLYSFPSWLVDKMTIFDEIKHVQRLAEAEAAGDPNAHNQLLAAIRKLQLAAEKPIDTTSRVNFQVGPMA